MTYYYNVIASAAASNPGAQMLLGFANAIWNDPNTLDNNPVITIE
jgi:hypothetical protein